MRCHVHNDTILQLVNIYQLQVTDGDIESGLVRRLRYLLPPFVLLVIVALVRAAAVGGLEVGEVAAQEARVGRRG